VPPGIASWIQNKSDLRVIWNHTCICSATFLVLTLERRWMFSAQPDLAVIQW